MPEITRERVVDVHHPTALRAEAVGIIYLKDTPEAKHAPPRRWIMQCAIGIGEARQKRGEMQVTLGTGYCTNLFFLGIIHLEPPLWLDLYLGKDVFQS